MLLKRGLNPIKNYDKRAENKKKRGLNFISCLKKSGINFEQIIYKRKVWVFKNVTDFKIKKFKKYWNEK